MSGIPVNHFRFTYSATSSKSDRKISTVLVYNKDSDKLEQLSDDCGESCPFLVNVLIIIKPDPRGSPIVKFNAKMVCKMDIQQY